MSHGGSVFRLFVYVLPSKLLRRQPLAGWLRFPAAAPKSPPTPYSLQCVVSVPLLMAISLSRDRTSVPFVLHLPDGSGYRTFFSYTS